MHLKRLNSAKLQLEIEPRGPLLIQSPIHGLEPGRPEMEFVRTRHGEFGESVYLPGTSLKGALRSHAERSLKGHGLPICAAFTDSKRRRDKESWDTSKDACHDKNRKGKTRADVFRQMCPNCRTFGSLAVAGRLNITDAYPWEPSSSSECQQNVELTNQTDKRTQVGIDRTNGQPKSGALFDLELVVQGKFHAELHLSNFQLWQLGLIGALIREIECGYLPLGFGTRRGLGQVTFRAKHLTVGWAGSCQLQLPGVASLTAPKDAEAYGLYGRPEDDQLELKTEQADVKGTWADQQLLLDSSNDIDELLGRLIQGPLQRLLSERGQG